MAKTTTTSPTSDLGPSRAAFTADPTPPSRPKTLGKRPYQDETKEANFNITNS